MGSQSTVALATECEEVCLDNFQPGPAIYWQDKEDVSGCTHLKASLPWESLLLKEEGKHGTTMFLVPLNTYIP